MNERKLIVILACLAGTLLVGGVAAVLLVARFLFSFSDDISPELETPGIITGESFLEKRPFFNDGSLGTITDIRYLKKPESTIGLAGLKGAVWITPSGTVKSQVRFHSRTVHVEFLDVDGNGKISFLNRGGHGWQDASFIDSSGRTTWTYGGMPGMDDMAAGDLDGDGKAEFVAGFNGNGGLRRLNRDGRPMWTKPGGNIWHVEIVDTDGDGKMEIVHSGAQGQITVRDGDGHVSKRARPAPYFAYFSICHWPDHDSPPRLLVAGNDKFWLLDFDGATVAELKAPGCRNKGTTHATPVRFGKDGGSYLAVTVDFDLWQRSALYVYDNDKTLVYQETLGEACSSVATIPNGNSKGETLLVGGEGRVWAYSRPK